MRTLGLLRHAKSDWGDPSLADVDRPLNQRGLKAAIAMAPVLAQCGFDRVLASTARRVRETLDHAWDGPVDWRDDIYGAGPSELLDIVSHVDPSVERILVVGHNPTMHMLATRLAVHGEPELLGRLADKYPTGALAVIDLPIGQWQEIELGIGTLRRFVRPRDLF